MKFYLSSYKYGDIKYHDYLKNWIKMNGNKLVFISNSRDLYPDTDIKLSKIEADRDLLRNIGFEIIDLSLKDYFGKEELLRNNLKQYNAFCLIGGNTFVLRKAMELSGFDNYLKDNLYNENILYMGYSAGICVLSKTLKGLDIVDEPVNIYNDDDVNYNGINIFEETFLPHYKSDHPESEAVDKVYNYLVENNMKFITLSDGDVVIREV